MATATKKRKKAEPKLSDADLVKASAAAPWASRAGTERVLEAEGVPLKITVTDDARATLEVEKHEPLTQAELQAAGKLLNQAIQGTY